MEGIGWQCNFTRISRLRHQDVMSFKIKIHRTGSRLREFGKNVLHDLDRVECHSFVRIGTPNENPKP